MSKAHILSKHENNILNLPAYDIMVMLLSLGKGDSKRVGRENIYLY